MWGQCQAQHSIWHTVGPCCNSSQWKDAAVLISGCRWECRNHSNQRAVQFSSVTQSCLIPCDPMDCSTPGLPVYHQLPEFTQTHVRWVSDASSRLILCHPLLLPSIFLSIRVFSNESVICIRWPNYWSFSLNISPSNEYSGLTPLGIIQDYRFKAW